MPLKMVLILAWVRTVDTDVIVIIVEKVHYLREQHPAADVWG